VKYLRILIGVAFSLLVTLHAFAQTSTTLDAIGAAAKRSGDRSRQGLVSVFGEVVNNPLAASGTGGGDTILSMLFQVTNGALLVIGGLFATYIWFRRLTQVSHEGTVFSKAQHTLWGPVRVVWGLASLVPTANGWALSQLMMLWAASLMGVGIANLGTDAAISAFQDGKGMIVQPAMPSTVTLARSIFEANLCMHSMNAGQALSAANGGFDFTNEYIQQYGLDNGFILKSPDQSKVCGGATLDKKLLTSQPQSTSFFSGTIDTSQIYQAHLSALFAMQSALSASAMEFVNGALNQMNGNVTQIADANLAIQSAALQYENYVNTMAGTKAGDIANLAGQLSSSIKNGGWWTIGAWYQTFAHANSKLSDAVSGKAQVFGEGFSGDQGVSTVRDLVQKIYKTQQSVSSDSVALGQTSGTTSNDTNKLLASMFSLSGQGIVNQMTNLNLGSAGGGTINPLIKMKNLGDYTLAAADSAVAGYVVAKSVAAFAGGTNGAGLITNLISGAGDVAKAVVDAVSPFFLMIVIPLFLVGAGLSIYLPLVPFIIWFGACINWLVVVMEAVVAAPLWAITHLGAEGDGMGARSAHGYIFLLNMMVRPFLMVVGFFGGGACMVVGGTFLNEIFSVAIANVQFDSITGLISMLGFLYVYFAICLNLIHSCFNLILLVPDQVINWVGGTASSALGRDTNEAVKNNVAVLANRLEHMHKGNPPNSGGEKLKPGNGIKQ